MYQKTHTNISKFVPDKTSLILLVQLMLLAFNSLSLQLDKKTLSTKYRFFFTRILSIPHFHGSKVLADKMLLRLQILNPTSLTSKYLPKYKCALSFSPEYFQFQVSSGRKLLQTKSIQTFAISRSPAGQQLPFLKRIGQKAELLSIIERKNKGSLQCQYIHIFLRKLFPLYLS